MWRERKRAGDLAFSSLDCYSQCSMGCCRSRTPEIMADAAWAILTRKSRVVTGRFFIDDEVLASEVRLWKGDDCMPGLSSSNYVHD